MNNELLQILNDIYVDYKSTTILAEVLSNDGVSLDDILIKRISAEQRYVCSDVQLIDYYSDENGKESLLLEVNREGIYDMLPEALFHQKLDTDRNEDARTKFERHRRQESESRKFFFPFENEFDKRLIYFELIERQINNQRKSKGNKEIFEYFFEENDLLNSSQRTILLFILPIANKIRGNVQLIKILLSKLFIRKIDVDEYQMSKIVKQTTVNKDFRLAVDFILGEMALEIYSKYVIRIYELNVEEYLNFQEGNMNAILLDYIIKYLFPINSEIKIEFHSKRNLTEEKFYKLEDSILDFNTYI